MGWILSVFLLFISLLHAQFSSDENEENPALFHHVNVITGDFNLAQEDTVVQGAKTLPIMRTYSSTGALEKNTDNTDLHLKKIKRDFLIQGGWSYFPHAHLLIRPAQRKEGFRAYVADRSGVITTYENARKDGKDHIILTPKESASKAFGKISGKSNKDKSLLRINVKEGIAILHLADGTRMCYAGKSFKWIKTAGSALTTYYNLVLEKLPSKHNILYKHDSKGRLLQVQYTNPSQDKTFSSISFYLQSPHSPYRFQAHTSDGKEIDYQFTEFGERDYMSTVVNKWGTSQGYEYTADRVGIGARVNGLFFNGNRVCKIYYHTPPSNKEAKKWEKHPEKKAFNLDKVQRLEGPLGPNGETVTYAKFDYYPGRTDVRDSEGLLTQYFHENNQPVLIQYFNQRDEYSSSMKFLWSHNKMTCKTKLDHKKEPLFSKTFSYDEAGNVTQETFWGNLTGKALGPYTLEPDGSLSQAESFIKTYAYSTRMNLLLHESEEGGLSYQYQYKEGTDLLTAKLTTFEGKIILREFLFYNEDHLVCAEITDDGCGIDSNDFSSVTERKIKRYELDPHNGLPIRITELFLDTNSKQEVMLNRVDLIYSAQKRVINEKVYDAEENYRYTIYTDYDTQGNIVRKTTPMGQEETYQYDPFGNLVESKEIGELRKKITYDLANRPLIEKEIDSLGNVKTTTSSYDCKGRLLEQIDSEGHVKRQTYDAFGQCISNQLPPSKDENGEIYTPEILFSYDPTGNLASTTNPNGETTRTEYTSLRKPYKITQADGSITFHVYNKSDTIQKTIHPDGTEEHFEYDYFKRMTQKTVYSADGDVLQEESWVYNTFHLLQHINEKGLITSYNYDGAGRLIEETSQDRLKRYVYDSLGFLERIYEGSSCQVQIHDLAGRVTEEWEEDSSGNIENKIEFTYDQENRKISATRFTSKGPTQDYFEYDAKGRLCSHTDPLQAVTRFIYTDDYVNKENQLVLQKKTIDPLGLIKIETFDTLSHIAEVERLDAEGCTVAKEELLYDCAGNPAKKISSIYVDSIPTKTHSISWVYDSCGRVIQEIESGKKTHHYQYNSRGWLIHKTLPSGLSLSYEYDGLGRIIEQKSSDGTIHYSYVYEQGPEPVAVEDQIHGSTLYREYNLFGQLVKEKSTNDLLYQWEYDSQGRCTSFILPDSSSISYKYSDLHLQSIARHRRDGISYVHTYEQFDPNGHVEKESLINNLGVITSERDLLERPSKQTSSWHVCHLSYGASGLVTQANNTLFGDKDYHYDALNQLKKEGAHEYHFDSLGNPVDCTTGLCNEVLSTPEFKFTYDEDGRPTSKKTKNGLVYYEYDALGRLTSIKNEKEEKTLFTYDAFSRLVSKETSLGKKLYLYNQEWEIGSVENSKEILELKILGLGIKGDIGAAIAIEIKEEIFAPLHDFNGNVVALIGSNGSIAESYDLNAFGQETLQTSESANNPWRFCSKRFEEGLIFFGLRFYDPSIGRWLTPDPAGFSDGVNLYVYVLNSPINRLDLFGLTSESTNYFPTTLLEVPLHLLRSPTHPFQEATALKGSIDGVEVDWIIKGGNWSQLKFTTEELNCGKVNVFNHFHELFPSEGKMIGLVSLQNGMRTGLNDVKDMVSGVSNHLPPDTLIVALHSPSKFLLSDLNQVSHEIKNTKETAIVALTRQYFTAISTGLFNVNPEALWLHIAHSRGGGIATRAAEGMTAEQKETMKKNCMYLGIGPSIPMPNHCAYSVNNVYSKRDFVTKWYGLNLVTHPDYTINYIASEPNSKRTMNPFEEHSFSCKTYTKVLNQTALDLHTNIGFFNGSSR